MDVMDKQINYNEVAGLVLILSAQSFLADKPKRGRLKNRVDKLEKLIVLPALTKEDSDVLVLKVSNFAKRTGWEGKKQDAAILISFCLALADDLDLEGKIVQCLFDIHEFMEQVEEIPDEYITEGGDAFKIWDSIDIELLRCVMEWSKPDYRYLWE